MQGSRKRIPRLCAPRARTKMQLLAELAKNIGDPAAVACTIVRGRMAPIRFVGLKAKDPGCAAVRCLFHRKGINLRIVLDGASL